VAVFISMLRGVNVGAHNRIKMDALRALYQSLGLEDPRTYVQSGNVIFRTKEKNPSQLAKKIQAALERTLKCSAEVILRTPDEFRNVIANNPFSRRSEIEPGKLLVNFLSHEPPASAHQALQSFKRYPEEIHLVGRELYIYFPNGAGKSKLPWASLARQMKVEGTARNWNSVVKMLEIAEGLER